MTQPELRKDFPATWDDIDREARALSQKLALLGPWVGIIGVTRGGLVPASIVAQELEIKLIETFCIVSYDNNRQQANLKILKNPFVAEKDKGKGWIVVDDLVDSGQTFKEIQKLLPLAHYACLYAKPNGMSSVDAYVTAVDQDRWITFPWDKKKKNE